MPSYIDGYAFPILQTQVETYRKVAEQVATIWKEHGALSYREWVQDDIHLAGTKSQGKRIKRLIKSGCLVYLTLKKWKIKGQATAFLV